MITTVENMSDDFEGSADEQGPAVDEEADDDDDAIDDVHALIFNSVLFINYSNRCRICLGWGGGGGSSLLFLYYFTVAILK